MFVVSGGAGFIGSHIVAEMEARGLGPIVVCDELGPDDRWRNLAKHTIDRFVHPSEFGDFLRYRGKLIEAVVHMGAIASTTEVDAQCLVEANVQSFRQAWNGCARAGIPLIYASSASVYGLDAGCLDDDSPAALRALRPVNAYGWSKKVCDECAAAWASRDWQPPFWAGLRFFNVYGANEGHKGEQRSYISKAIDAGLRGEPIRLFPGNFARDWVYVLDVSRLVVDMLAADPKPASGIYNVGSGEAHGFNEVLHAVASATGTRLEVHTVEMPEAMRAGYQPNTRADLTKLRAAMPGFEPTSLEDGLAHYVFSFTGSGWDAYR